MTGSVSFRSSRRVKRRWWCSPSRATPVRGEPPWKTTTPSSLCVLQQTQISMLENQICVLWRCVWCVSCLRTLWRSWLRTLSSARRKDEVSLFAGPPPCWRLCPDRWRAWRSSEGFPVSEITRSGSSRSAESVISRLASSSHSERI